MRAMHEFLKTAPFDVYELHLFHLVASHGSFTKAAEVVGLTQSAVTRQVQGIERRLGLTLFERTTRSVRLTEAGHALFHESVRLLADVERTLQTIRQDYGDAKRIIRFGVSRSVGLAYLPGFFHANLRRAPKIGYRISYQSSADIIAQLEKNELDVGVLCPPRRLPRTLRLTHTFRDAFTLIVDAREPPTTAVEALDRSARAEWLNRQTWLVLDERANTGGRLKTWMERQGLAAEPAMQLDSFDLIINLVAMGMGCAFVPVRALALYARKRSVRRVIWPERFERELVVVVRHHRQLPQHIQQFIENVLF